MKLFIIGHARHGKDTVAEMIRDHCGLTFESSSHIACRDVVMPYLKKHENFTYNSVEEAYADRVNHRMAWYHAIKEYNTPNLRRLSTLIFGLHDIYVGIRDREEFLAARDMADLSIWVDANYRLPADDLTCKILRSDADVIIDNSTTLADLMTRTHRLMNALTCPACDDGDRLGREADIA